MSGETITGAASSHPFLQGGFRPFFLAAPIWGLLAIALWLLVLTGKVALPSNLDPLAWHRHEMLFGYAGGIIAGFLLTAIPNWTGRLPLAGMPLALLAGLWLSARIGLLLPGAIAVVTAIVLDVGFYLVLAFFAAREVIAAGNRNLPVVVAVALVGLANLLDHADMIGLPVPAGIGWRMGFGVILMLIALVGGRIIPSFTTNWLKKNGATKALPGQPDKLDQAALVLLACALVAWVAAPASPVSGVLLTLAAAGQTLRLARWKGRHTAANPLLLFLHLAFAWLPAGLAVLGASALGLGLLPSTGLHMLGVGAVASMTLAVMTRATLGHTGRELKAGPGTITIYALVTAAALARASASLFASHYLDLVLLAGGLWVAAFAAFIAVYAPMLLRKRMT